METLGAFWNSLPLLGKIYLAIAIPSTLLFLVIFAMSLVGHDVDSPDGGVDADVNFVDGLGGFFVSFKAILSFFMVFSWAGLSSVTNKWSFTGSLIISIISGLVAMFLVALLMYFMSKLTYSGTVRMEDGIGKEATVYLTIPAKKQGKGKIEVILSGALRVVDAMTEELEDIKTGSLVEVEDIINNEIYLVKSKR